VFQVGVFDGSSAEFAQGRPKGEVRYVPGQSVAARDWYAFQPAALSKQMAKPGEGAANPRTIEFQLQGDPSPAYRLKVALLFEDPSVPALRVTINDKAGMYYPEPQLDSRLGDVAGAHDTVYSNADISFAFPGDFLHKGLNTITFQAVEETNEAVPDAGFTYDAIELDRIGAGPIDLDSSTRIKPTVFFTKHNSGLSELVDVTIRSSQSLRPEDSVSLTLGGKTYEKQIGISRDFGETTVLFEVDEFPPQSLACELAC
jgi:alpha-mannosidase